MFLALNCSIYMANNNHHYHSKPVCSLWPAEHFKHTIHAQTTSKQTARQNVGNSPPHTSATLIPSTLRLVLRGRLGWHQTKGERERISKIIRKEQRKTAEEESALLCRSCAPYLLNDKPNLPLTNLPAPAPEEKERHKRDKEIL